MMSGTWEDASKDLDLVVRKQIEAAFRRGYLFGADDMLTAIKQDVSIELLTDYVAETLWQWYLDDKSKAVKPPSICEK